MTSHASRYNLEVGQIFEENYEIVRELGRGGFGVIYLAHQISMDRPVALKILKPEVGAHDPSARERFLREVRIISKLRHPNTVTIHDFGETADDVAYMVLEYIEGETLENVIEREGAQPPLRALGLARQIAKSLAEAHKHDVIHRDLKPANIMLTDIDGDPDFVKVLDFGVARLRGTQDVDLTQGSVGEGEQALIGTPRYMSPEQVKGEQLSPASDLYSLGLMLYEVLVGKPAVEGDTTMALIGQQISPEPLELDSLTGLHPRLQDLIRRATDKSIAQRFQSGNEFADTIDQAVQRLRAEQGVPQPSQEFLSANKGASPDPSSEVVGPDNVDASQPQFRKTIPQYSEDAPSEAEPAESIDEVSEPRLGEFGAEAEPDASGDEEWLRSGYDPDSFEDTAKSYDSTGRHGAVGNEASEPTRVSGSTSNTDSNFIRQDIIDSEGELAGVPLSELPEKPDYRGSVVNNAEPEPKPDQPVVVTPRDAEEQQPEDDEPDIDLFEFGFVALKLTVLGVLASFFVYTAFVVLGALVGELVEGTMRLAVAAGVGIAIPLMTALGENSQKERFEVVERGSDRLARVFIGSAIFAAAVTFIICFAAPAQVISNLRAAPNWMFGGPRVANPASPPHIRYNQQLSFAFADLLYSATIEHSWYGVIPAEDRELRPPSEDPPAVTAPPEPTRPGNRQGRTGEDDGDDDGDDSGDTPEGSSTNEDSVPDEQPPPDRRPDSEDDSDSEDDYVNW